MLGTMQNQQKKYNGKKPGLGILIIVIVMLLGYVFDSGENMDLYMLLPVLIIVGAFLLVYVFTKMLMKTQSGTSAKTYAKPTAARKTTPEGYTGTEEAIHCAHSRGKQKYLEQIESFLANGIIDKAEYRTLKARYEKLDLPEDFH